MTQSQGIDNVGPRSGSMHACLLPQGYRARLGADWGWLQTQMPESTCVQVPHATLQSVCAEPDFPPYPHPHPGVP